MFEIAVAILDKFHPHIKTGTGREALVESGG
jgi:hypothetical protein